MTSGIRLSAWFGTGPQPASQTLTDDLLAEETQSPAKKEYCTRPMCSPNLSGYPTLLTAK
jgi:hypothetical protein